MASDGKQGAGQSLKLPGVPDGLPEVLTNIDSSSASDMGVNEEDASKADQVARWTAAVETFDDAEPSFGTLMTDTSGFMESMESADRASFRRSQTATTSLADFVSLKRSTRLEFEDLDTLKMKLAKQHYAIDIDAFYWETGWAQRIARSWRFHQVMLAWIVVYSIWIAVDADYNTDDGSLSTLFVVVDNVFCCVFTGEWLVRFAAFKKKSDIKHDGWFMFDTVLVTLGVMDTWVLAAVLHFTASADASTGSSYEFRLLRLLRLTV
eukprot:TRINITY_DN13056_c0_g2_i1.p1 TRINITY_DN13056_c0_g2~~TRINITY_DN13056_c0_g2_i1.p1  ORF type:complete len:265 (+),score=54.31 TRINITY_DN13056_c0_g2_i1:56-850(+)